MEDKYGQVYPERAVLPMRRLCEALLTSAVSRGGDSQTVVQAKALRGVLDDLEAEGFPEDEPLFLMRGQDVIAPDIVRIYANERIKREEEQSGGGRTPGHGDEETHLRLYEHADRMAAWQPRKMPD
jgi:hypothetical protein